MKRPKGAARMLTALHIEDFVLIERLTLSLGEGLTVLTGETGAGKSILLDALGLAAGGRADGALVRAGATQASVAAAFSPGAAHPVWRLLEEQALAAGDDIILRRVQMRDGKSRAFVNDRPVSVTLLRDVGEALVEICGQHDGRGFLAASAHRSMLDAFGGLEKKVAAVGDLWRAFREAEAEAERRRQSLSRAQAEADYLRHVAGELSELAPKAGEEAALADRRSELQAAARVTDDLRAALDMLSGDGLEGKLAASLRRLVRTAAGVPGTDHPLTKAVARIETALSETLEARAALEEAARRLCGDEGELDRAEARLFALRAAARKHGVPADRLCDVLEKAQQSLAQLDTGEAELAALDAERALSEERYRTAAADLSKARIAAAQALDAAVARELAPLKLGRAEFRTAIKAAQSGPEGVDLVEFMVATNPGAPSGPLKAIASGGELSRFVLAMKAALAAKEERTVVIFDEIDSGVGGAAADAVGERLARLAQDAQVLVVTHSPQVAARARTHWRVEKVQSELATRVSVDVLDETARVEEIARMLSGARISQEARAAARRLLGGAFVESAPTARRKRA